MHKLQLSPDVHTQMNYQDFSWCVRRLHRGSGKARWKTVATGLNEFEARRFASDAQKGSTSCDYRAERTGKEAAK